MPIPAQLAPPDLLFFAHVIAAVMLWQALRRAPWRQLRAVGLRQHLFLGATLALALLWNLSAGLKPGLSFHFMGVTVFTLMFGWPLAMLGVSLACLGLAWREGALAAVSLNALLFGMLPVAISYAVYHQVQQRLPHHLFVYVFLCAFFGSMLAAAGATLAAVGVLVYSNAYTYDYIATAYLPFLPLYLLPEGLLNGMLTMALVGLRPDWLATFDEHSYLNR